MWSRIDLSADRRIHTKVRGTTFQRVLWSKLAIGDRVDLVREPDNPADRNAIRVIHHVGHIGYISRKLARFLAILIDQDQEVRAHITQLTGGEEGRNQGINVQIVVNDPGGVLPWERGDFIEIL